MTPAERRQRQLARIFQLGWDSGADDPPLTERQIERLAFQLNPHVADPNRRHTPAALPQAA